MKKIVIFALGLVLTFSACSDFAAVGDLDKVVSDLDSLSQRLTDLETRVSILEDLDISATVLAIETMQGDINTNLESIDALQEELLALEEELDNNAGSGDASTVYWGDVKTAEQYKELEEGNYTKITGAVDVNSTEDVALLKSIDYIGSDLNISGIAGEVQFTALKSVSGSININDIAFENNAFLNFPSLEFINGNLYTYGEAHGLDSISSPSLTAIMGDVAMTFSKPNLSDDEFTFSAINISALLMVGGNFDISMSLALQTLKMPVAYIGGDFNLVANAHLYISQSDFSNVEYIGGSIYFSSNFDDFDGNDQSQLFDAILFDNLTTIGGSISINGSQDMYNLSGFSKLQYIPGDLNIQLSGMMLGHESDIRFFNSLTTIDGFLQVKFSENVVRSEDQNNTSALAGFESLVTVGTDVEIAVDQIKGFESLEESGVELVQGESGSFKVSATTLPKFSAFKQIRIASSTITVSTSSPRVANLFPVLAQNEFESLSLILTLFNETEVQTVASTCFENVTHLQSLTLSAASGMELDNDFMNNLSIILPEGDEYDDLVDSPSGFIVEVEVNEDFSDVTDLSMFADLFTAKAADIIYADSAWTKDNANYEMAKQYFEAGLYTQQQLDDFIPVRQNQYADNFEFYTHAIVDGANVRINYSEEKMDPDSEIPALIQCFMKFGDLTAEELGY